MADMKIKGKRIPLPGLRIQKSVLAVFLGFVIYILRGYKGIPFYTALSALQCMQPLNKSSFNMARKRITGTFIGAVFGVVSLLIELQIPEDQLLLIYLVVCLFCGIVLYATVLIKVTDSSYFSCVVFLSITINHVRDANPYLFAWNRVLDTLIGIALAILVNNIHIPEKRNDKVLFVSGIDDVLLDRSEKISAHHKVVLNRLMEHGCHFTISTTETPATIRELVGSITLKLPVIAMDGAILYDMDSREVLEKDLLSDAASARMIHFLDDLHVPCFINSIIDNQVLIFYEDSLSPAEQNVLERRRKSPYRVYLHRNDMLPTNVAYFFMIDEKAKIEALYTRLLNQEWASDYRFVCEPARRYEGCAFLKIYSPTSSREKMTELLKERCHMEKVVTIGSKPDQYDVYIDDPNNDTLVKAIRKYSKA